MHVCVHMDAHLCVAIVIVFLIPRLPYTLIPQSEKRLGMRLYTSTGVFSIVVRSEKKEEALTATIKGTESTQRRQKGDWLPTVTVKSKREQLGTRKF